MGDRHQFRAKWHDYNGGIYFVTICAYKKSHTFGRIVGTRFFACDLGEIVKENITNIPQFYKNVEILNDVVMPNHIHLVISIGMRLFASTENSNCNEGCIKPSRYGEECSDNHHNSRLATIIGAFKAGVSRTVRTRRIASLPVWQSRYHEHIIRNQRAFDNIMNYVDTNVVNWGKDCFAK